MDFRLIDHGWGTEIDAAASVSHAKLLIVCPFIQRNPVQRLIDLGRPQVLQVLTRYNLDDFACGVSDPAALQLLLENGARIRGIKGLHAKLYLFDNCALLTSANLTDTGLHDNHEFGFISHDSTIIWKCQQYFNSLWHRSGNDLTSDMIRDWEIKLQSAPRAAIA
jgi:phosphatidylserine/phosphatidylglycerophosphate/cardiolipin synthase-like enzyme